MKKIIPLVAVILIFAACKKENNSIKSLSVTDKSSTEALINDIDGVAATPTIKIGTQKWMTLNLNVTRYRNGDKIPQVKNAAAWAALTTGAWCYYNNDPSNAATYGKLYNWYAVNDPRGLAPVGFHVPSDAEWTTLSTFLGGSGGALKSTGTIESGTGLWYAPNTDATNSSGFTGLPGSFRANDATFGYIIGYVGFWWSSTERYSSSGDSWYWSLSSSASSFNRFYDFKNDGFSVRCLKD